MYFHGNGSSELGVENDDTENDHKRRHDTDRYHGEFAKFMFQGLALVFPVESFLLTADRAYSARIALLHHNDYYKKHGAERGKNKTRDSNRLESGPSHPEQKIIRHTIHLHFHYSAI